LSRISAEERSALSLRSRPGCRAAPRFDPPFQRRRRDPLGGGDRDLVEPAALVGQRLGDRSVTWRSRRRRGGAAELGEADQFEFLQPTLATRPISSPSSRCADSAAARSIEASSARVAGAFDVTSSDSSCPGRVEEMNLGANWRADCFFALRVEEATGVKSRAGGLPHPGRCWIRGRSAALTVGTSRVFLFDRVLRRDHDAGPLQRLAEDFVEAAKSRVGEDVGAGDESDPESRPRSRSRGPAPCAPDALEREGPVTGGLVELLHQLDHVVGRRPGRRPGRICRRAR